MGCGLRGGWLARRLRWRWRKRWLVFQKASRFLRGASLKKTSRQLARKEEARIVLLEILREGCLRIRVFGDRGRADLCANEADHLHNLPELIRDLQLEYLEYYFDVSRPAYLVHAEQVAGFQPLWDRLAEILWRMRAERKL